jgi:hypothetical protein
MRHPSKLGLDGFVVTRRTGRGYADGMRSEVRAAVDTYIRAASERDAQTRARMLQECFAEDGRLISLNREIRGRAALVQEVEKFLSDPSVLGVRVASAIDIGETTFRFRSVVERRDGRNLEFLDTGQVDENGRISLILTFAGPLGPAADE